MSSIRSPKQTESKAEVSYQKLKGTKIPDVSLMMTNEKPTSLVKDLPKRYVLVVQPGPSSTKCVLPSNWGTIPGAAGCTMEATSFNKLLADFAAAGFAVFLLNNKSHAQQLLAKKEKFLNVDLLSDEKLEFAHALDIKVREVNVPTTQSTLSYEDRVTLIVEDSVILDVIDQIKNPARNAEVTLARVKELAAKAGLNAGASKTEEPSTSNLKM